MRKFALLLTCLLVCGLHVVFAQSRAITGKVTDADEGSALPGVSVVVKGTTIGTITDADGKYKINVPQSAETLTFSFVGMKTREQKIEDQTEINVTLTSSDVSLDEFIVVAYGTAKKSAFTGSASVVDSKLLEKRQVSNVSNALSGTVAGVQTLSTNGQPGESATVRIRGIGSINAGSNPLYVVDGIPYEGSISSINSMDIESMTVLKDAAAAALYGARGANGVIMVTTKKGKSGVPTISFDARTGVNSRLVTNYDVLERPDTYLETAYSAYYNSYAANYSPVQANNMANANMINTLGYQIYTVPVGQNLIGTNGRLNPNATLGYSDGTYYYTPDNWADGTFSNQLRQEYNFSIRGGNDKLIYYFSAGYLSDNGVIEDSGFDRITTRLSVDYQVKDWLKIGANVGLINAISYYPEEQTTTNSSVNAFYIANSMAPIYPMFVRNADGSFAYDRNTGYKIYDYGDGASSAATRNFMSMSNPMGDLLYDTNEYLTDAIDSKWYIKANIVEGLTATATLGYLLNSQRYHNAGNKYYGQSAPYGGSVIQETTRGVALVQQYLVNYKKEFGFNNIDFLAGYESLKYGEEDHYIQGYNKYSDTDWTAGNVIDKIDGSGSFAEYEIAGFLSRLSYDYDERYYASLSFRRDGSSRFHPDNRWGNFWSASAAWDMSKESFLNAHWIDMLKLKASFGQQGNDNIGNYYAYEDQYRLTGADGVFSDGTLIYKGNKELTWESSNSFNTGVDFNFLGNKLNGTVEYFLRQTSDMLYNKPVAPSNGYSSIPMNIGSMRNSGVEIELEYVPIETNDISWSLNWNGTLLKNKIISLHPDLEGQLIDGSRIYQEGESMYQFYFVEWAGVNAENGLAQYNALDADGVEYATDDWNAAFNSNRKATGDILPKIYGGFGTTVDFYGFDFSIQCAYQLGGRIFDTGYQNFMHGGRTTDMGENWHKDILDAWTPANTNTDVPRMNNLDKYSNSTSTRWLTSSNFLAVNNITFGYSLPKRWLKPLHIESLRVYAVADNLALSSARKGLDPRMSYTAATTSTYTALRTISGGLKLSF